MNKKGVEITFNWIFVIVAGSVLLLFFMYFSWKQIGLFNKIGVNEIVENINNEIDSFSIGLSSSKLVQVPKDVVFSFRCGNVIYKDTKKDTLNLIYSKGNLQNSFILWTKAWMFPFKIDNFYYAANNNKRFFVIGNDNLLFDVPDKFKKFNNLNQEINPDDVIVDFTNSNIFNNHKDNRVLVVDKSKGLITFYPERKREEFYGDGMLLGAMFTDYEDYVCLKNKALDRLNIITELYKKKTDLLKLNSKCSLQYTQVQKTLDLFKREPLKYKSLLIDQNDQIKKNGCANVF